MFDRYAPLMGAAPSAAHPPPPPTQAPPAQKAITHEYRDALMPMRQGMYDNWNIHIMQAMLTQYYTFQYLTLLGTFQLLGR